MPTMWDGHKFFQADEETASQLVKEDKAEICVGNALKYRHQFSGYQTREMRAEPKLTEVGQRVLDDICSEPEVIEPEVKEAPKWQDYKTEAKKKLGLKRISEKQVKEWMRDNGII